MNIFNLLKNDNYKCITFKLNLSNLSNFIIIFIIFNYLYTLNSL